MVAPLDDITVVAIDSWMAGPSAGAILADLGATVIKVEPLTGDPMRDMGRLAKSDGGRIDYDFQFDVDNRGKQSIRVDLTSPEGRDIVKKLCSQAEIFICNLLTHRQEKYEMDPQSLFKVNPKLVHATITGYGTDGPEAWRPGFDVTAFFGRSGLYDASREGEDGVVPMARPAQGDHVTGLALASAVLSALRLAERTGSGQAVETSLYEAAVWSQASDYATTAVDHAPVRKRAREGQLSPATNRYPCGDGKWVVFNMPDPSKWPKFCKTLGQETWIERYLTAKDRYDAMPQLVPEIDKVLSAKGRDEWGKIFDDAGLIWGPVLALHEVATDEQANAIGLFPTLSDETIGDYRTVRIPMRFAGADVGPQGRSPKAGEHTSEVLQQAGYTDDEITQFTNSGIVK
jgi:crotonobetainyl-CoA:carnitine CoA-transferase CaiB-like acyl-CoA transferase